MEYVSHIWGGSTHTALLETVESRAFRLINSPALTNSLQSLSAGRIVASLTPSIAITMDIAFWALTSHTSSIEKGSCDTTFYTFSSFLYPALTNSLQSLSAGWIVPHSLYIIAITMGTALLYSLVAYLLHWEGLVQLVFLHSLILSLSNSLTQDLTAILNLTCTLLVKSGTHSLHLFSQFPLTWTLLNTVYQVMSAIDEQFFDFLPNFDGSW